MKKLETDILKIFLNHKNDKLFFIKINKILQKYVGFKLLTFTVMHPNNKFVKRIYSSNKKKYPVGGTKKIPKNYWSEITIQKKRSFIGNNKKQIEKYFFDHRIITSLGCESILNQVVVFDNETIGTINLLNKENYFKKKHLIITNMISKFLTPTYLNFQKKIRRK